jgi:diguanylate cyclase (GGDEF)-like protein
MFANLSGGVVCDSMVAGLPLGRVSRASLVTALIIVTMFGGATLLLLPVAARPLPGMAGFVPAYQTAVFLLYALSFLHLASYVRHTGATALLHIAGGCLFSALILLVQMFSFPIWGPTQLVGRTPATTTWLWTFWHLGPMVATVAYLVARRAGGPQPMASIRAADTAVVLTALGSVLLVGAATAIATLGLPWLPTVVQGDDYRALTHSGVGPAVLIATAASFAALVWRTRCATQVELCLAISLALLAMDDALTLVGGSRLSVGWYAGRAEAALSAVVLLGLFMTEINRRFARISQRAQSLATRQSELARHVRAQYQENTALQRLVRLDGLTALPNRRSLDEALRLEWRRGRRDLLPLTLLMIDIDHFKHYNDQLGYPAGDACLLLLSGLLRDLAGRSGDIGARYGGDEFALLLPGTDLHGGRVIAEMLRTALLHARIPHPAAPSGLLTVSIGVAATIPVGDEAPPDLLVAAAERALDLAKRSGRDRVVTVSEPLQPAGAEDFGVSLA